MTIRWRLFSVCLTVALLTGAGATALPELAEACGGLFCQRIPVDQAGERILFATDGQDVTAHVQIQYQGDAKDFSWVVPVPSEPKLGVGSDALFTALRNATRPNFNLTLRDEGECARDEMMSAESNRQGLISNNAGGLIANNSGVQIVQQAQVGPFDSVVLKSDDRDALVKWLRENDYDIPAKLDPLLSPYIEGKYYFVALKLTKNKSAGDIQPIVLKYKSTKPGIPIRLTGIAATNDMDVYVWVLGDQRAIPENYRHAQINEARIDWMNQGQNYRTVVTEAMNEAGGQAWVTDYAGDTAGVQLDTFTNKQFNLDGLRASKDYLAFARDVSTGGYFDVPPNGGGGLISNNVGGLISNRGDGSIAPISDDPDLAPISVTGPMINFFKGHIPKPASLAQVDDFTFYANLGRYRAELAATQFNFDLTKAVAELDDTVVTPYRDIAGIFNKFKYMTQLYTTMSPDEMTQDPMFIFNKDLPKVSNRHEAKGVRKCSSEYTFDNAPIEITLENGLTYRLSQNGQNGDVIDPKGIGASPRPVVMPAAARIEQLKGVGLASLIQDNQESIRQALGIIKGSKVTVGGTTIGFDANGQVVAVPASKSKSAAGGFGCAGCAATNTAPQPRRQGAAGEGLAYALIFLGFLGWRRFARKP